MQVFSITVGGCSCDLLSVSDDKPDATSHAEKLKLKYRKLGWSKAKIARAIEDHAKHHLQRPQIQPLRADVEDYLDRQLQTSGRLELLAHFHSGPFTSEPFNVGHIIDVEVADRLHFDTFAEDTRYVCTLPSVRQ